MICDMILSWTMLRVIAAALLVLLTGARAGAATSAEVDAAIDRARQFLYSKQQPTGQWESDLARRGVQHEYWLKQGDTFGGFTAIAVYALLTSGENPQDPRLSKAITFLENADVVGIYSLGLRANVWTLLPPTKRYKEMSERDARLIILGMQTGKDNRARGFWDYGNGHGLDAHPSQRFDHSVSQYGVLGLWACAQNGANIPRSVWETIDEGWRRHQFPDGGWGYDSAPPGGGVEFIAMTAAGVATLFITQDILNSATGAECRGNVSNDNIERGLAWMTAHFDEIRNAYGYYGIERIGVASGRKYFGANNWYVIGADKMIKSQNRDGSWTGGGGGGMEDPIPCTAFCLLFLARGRESIMITKLQYDLTSADTRISHLANWNQRPRDIANLTRWVGNRIERDLNWQTLSLAATLDELHEAPVLYLSGDQSLAFTKDEEAKLREFILGGGLVLANADCGLAKSQFADSFEELGHRMFPAYSFRDLPAEHPIFSNEQYLASRWKSPQRVRGLSNGVRELMLLIPDADPARAWQTHGEGISEASFQLGADIFLYAVDKRNLRNKGDGYIIRPDMDIIADRTARIGRLQVGDNWDPEPGGWQRMAALFHNRYTWDLNIDNVTLGDKKLSQFKLLHLTGTSAFHLSRDEREKLVEFIIHGGTLVIDAAGGSREFADAAAEELGICFGALANKGLSQPLDGGSAVFNLPGAKIGLVDYREWYRRRAVGTLRTPRLNGIEIRGRTAVFFSRQDISAGLVGQPVDGVSGYSPASATELMRNIVLYGAFGVRPGSADPKK